MSRNLKPKGKQAFIALALIVALTLSAFVVFMPAATAHSPPWNYPTWTYIVAYNNVIGVGQQEKFIFWLGVSPPPTASGQYGDRWSFFLDVTSPEGTKIPLGPYTSDPVGGGYAFYTPTEVGNYTVVARFPGKTINGQPNGLPSNWGPTSQGYTAINDTYAASTSDPITITVTQAPLALWPEAPLPTQFWTRPISAANFNWWPLAANWLGGGAQTQGPTTSFGYGTAPLTAHIMWKTPADFGGIMDARFGDALSYATSHYEGLNFNPIIIDGKIYFNSPNSEMREGWYVMDLYTGQQEYFYNTTGPVTGAGAMFDSHGGVTQQSLGFGQILNLQLPSQMGGYPYLWSQTASTPNTWLMYDAYTYNYICSINNVPSFAAAGGGGPFGGGGGTTVYAKDGSILVYAIVNVGTPAAPKDVLECWNTTQAIWWHGTQQQYQNGDFSAFPGNNYNDWRPYLNTTFDGSHGYTINASIPTVQGSIKAVRQGQFVIGGTSGTNNENGITLGQLWTLNLDPSKGAIGTVLSNVTFTPPSSAGNVTVSLGSVDPEDGVFIFSCVQTKEFWGYSLASGKQIWGPTTPEDPMKYYGLPTDIYQGMLISYTYLCGGSVYSYNITTGQLLWKYEPSQIGYESPYGDYPAQLACIVDGKIFIYSSPLWRTNPMWRGSYLRCLNATNGVELWQILHYGSVVAADGFLVGLNYYDNEIYCYGKGPSATTVTASPAVSTQGDEVLVQGTVTDQSPGAKGTPAIADVSQEAWMEYLYEQQAMPSNATGVQVHLTAFDPNNNTEDLGFTTSDASGNYAKMFTPPVPGVYKVTASFDGSNAYYGSSAEVAFGVSKAKSVAPSVTATPPSTTAPTNAPTQAPTQAPTVAPTPSSVVIPPTNAAPTATYIAIGLAVVIIVAAAAALVLRRRHN